MKLVIAAAIAAFSVTAASAADLPYAKAPPVDPARDWSGFYIGVNGGGNWSHAGSDLGIGNNSYTPIATATVLRDGNNGLKGSGALVGGQIGYIFTNSSTPWVVAVEASFDWVDAKASVTRSGTFFGAPFDTFNQSVKQDWLALFTGRVGYNFGGWIPYLTAGLAVSEIKFASAFSDILSPAVSSFGASQIKVGLAAGAGLEYRFDHHWSLRGEWLYVAFENIEGSAPVINPNTGVQYNIAGGGLKFLHSVNYTQSIARAALSYKF
ncbi:outer membrane protein [Bradyrhizobium prioriisuperbiae]|uniref:outer membrane protein n=1 Tax=Bradyrhizobium prioriisuperbiae TaxID=2854389 RepID=UPI0028EDC018|nr:outer membrane beta-barrel protein [Bradyrhizobium prioritasuperba]